MCYFDKEKKKTLWTLLLFLNGRLILGSMSGYQGMDNFAHVTFEKP